MSVYVDNARIPYHGMIMYHMLADSTAELLAMADRIGLNRKWIQNPGSDREHFDVGATKRALAVRAGAVEIGAREVAAILRNRRDSSPSAGICGT